MVSELGYVCPQFLSFSSYVIQSHSGCRILSAASDRHACGCQEYSVLRKAAPVKLIDF